MSIIEEYKRVLKDNLDNYARDSGMKEFNNCSTVFKGKIFLQYYLDNFFSYENPDIGEDILSACIIDGSNDLGIDFLYDDENRIIIIQSKYGKNQITREVLTDFKDIPSRLRSQKYIEEKGNEYLKSLIREIKNVNTKPIRLVLLTDQIIPDEDQKYWEESICSSSKEVEISFTDLNYLKEEYVRLSSQSEDIPDCVDISIGGEDNYEFSTIDDNYPTIMVTQTGNKIRNLYNRYKERLFNYNIRYWLGKNPVNKAMIDTIETEPERFFYYNNGITAVCEEMIKLDVNHEKIIRCKHFQIINGAQTFTTIAKEGSGNLSSVKILLKIIEAETGKKTKSQNGLNESIVKNTNNQTAVTVSDFKSNDQIQYFLERELQKLSCKTTSPFKQLYYKRKRSKALASKGTLCITMQDFGKAYYSGFYGPIDLNSSVSRLWDSITDRGLYNVAFGINGEKTDVFSPSRINKMLSAYFIFQLIKNFSKQKSKEEDPSQLFKYHILWGVLRLIRDKHPFEQQEQEIYNAIVDRGAFLNSILFPDEHKKFIEYIDTVSGAINYLISETKEEEAFVMRNIQRSKKFFEKLERYLINTKAITKLESLF